MTRFLTAFALLALLPLPAHAAYTGPTSDDRTYRSVAEVLEYPSDGNTVVITGHLIRKIGHEKYLFRDTTGSIRAEIDQHVLPAADFDDKTHVTLEGEIDSEFLANPELDISRVTLLR